MRITLEIDLNDIWDSYQNVDKAALVNDLFKTWDRKGVNQVTITHIDLPYEAVPGGEAYRQITDPCSLVVGQTVYVQKVSNGSGSQVYQYLKGTIMDFDHNTKLFSVILFVDRGCLPIKSGNCIGVRKECLYEKVPATIPNDDIKNV